MRGRREPGQLYGCGGSVPGAAGGLRPLVGSCSQPCAHVTVVCKWACAGLGDEVNSIGAGLGVRGRLGWYCVLWLFQGCCSGGSLGHWSAAALGEGGLRKRS